MKHSNKNGNIAFFGDALNKLIALLGEDGALALIEAFGGTRLYIPENARLDSRIVDVIGLDGVGRLAENYGGFALTIPLAKGWRVGIYRRRGLSYNEIATKVAVSQTFVWRHLAARRLTNPAAQLAANATQGGG